VPHRLGRESAAAELDALIRAVEAVSASQDPAEIASFLAANGVAIGPTRITRRPVPYVPAGASVSVIRHPTGQFARALSA